MTAGDERVRANLLSFTNFLQEMLQDLAKSVTFFLSMLPPDIGKFYFRDKSHASNNYIVGIFYLVRKGHLSHSMRDNCPVVLPSVSFFPTFSVLALIHAPY